MDAKQLQQSVEKLKTELRSWYSKVSVNELTRNKRLLTRIQEIESLLLEIGGQIGKPEQTISAN